MKKPKPKTVELVSSDYQPSKAEKEEEFQINASMEELTRAVVQLIKPRWIDKPRKLRQRS